ncbi:MAG: ATP-binding cassette domain-containing protein, partial [Paracoccaceae bacterium]
MTKPEPILSVRDLSVVFEVARRGAMPWMPKDKLKAVDNISFDLYPGQTLGVVGESGCGKSTLARAIIRMLPAETGQVLWLGQDLLSTSDAAMKEKRRDLQMIFQDPLASLDPRMTIGEIVAEPLKTHFPRMGKAERGTKVRQVLEKVGILPNLINRYPHEFSGGQCQRI